MEAQAFDFLKQQLMQRSGAMITPEKGYLIESRLTPIAKRLGHDGIVAMVSSLMLRPDETVLEEIVDAMTTNETLFFRDGWPFEKLKDTIIPDLVERNAGMKRIRIWSAACSSGQEPYSIAMTLSDMRPLLAGWHTGIVGTDICSHILDRARAATYSDFEVRRGLSDEMRERHFVADGPGWKVKPELRHGVEIRKFNLLSDPMSAGLFGFDVVFCRNVLIYFDEPTRTRVLSSIARAMRPGGYLVMGGAETVVGFSDAFRLIPGQRGLFQLSNGPVAATDCARSVTAS